LKKNLLVLVTSVLLVLIGAWLVRMPRDVLIYSICIMVAVVPMSLMIEDLWRKMFDGKDNLTWQYFVGTAIVFLSVLAWLWTVESVTMQELWLRLGVCAFSGALASYWFYGPYERSLNHDGEKTAGDRAEEREARRWERVKKKVKKIKGSESKAKVIAKNLRYRLTGDTLDGGLVFDKPLAFFEGKCLSLSEVGQVKSDNEDDPINGIKERAERYINALIKEGE